MEQTLKLSEKTIVTDPCYTIGTWCQGVIETLPGEYNHEVEYDKQTGRVAAITITHKNVKIREEDYELTDIDVGVDSGQAGFFNLEKYPEGDTGEYGDKSTFYGKVCEMTLSSQQYGVWEDGFVSSSGWGDGSYDCYVVKNKDNKVVSARIIFISEEEEDENNEDEMD